MLRKWIVGIALVAGCALFVLPEDASARCRRACGGAGWNRGCGVARGCNTGCGNGFANGYSNNGSNVASWGQAGCCQGGALTQSNGGMQYSNGVNTIGTAPNGAYTTGYQPQVGTINSDGTIVNGTQAVQQPNTYAPQDGVNLQNNNNQQGPTNFYNSEPAPKVGRSSEKATTAPQEGIRNE